MALRIDQLRFRNILVRGEVPEAPVVEFADALDDTFSEQLDGVATRQDLERVISVLKADSAECEARLTRQQQFIIGLVMGGLLTLIGFAIAILLAVLL